MATGNAPNENKRIVLEAFDTLFNRRDFEKAATFWSPDYIQHSAHIEPGREGLFDLVKSTSGLLRYENALIVAEGDFVHAARALHRTAGSTRHGSPSTSCGWRTACLPSIGTSSRTRQGASSRKADCRCSATSFLPDPSPKTQFRRITMKLSGNTIFVTGGGSGIGRGLAEELHKLGNKVIISGRRRANLDEVVAANPGMEAIELDITDPASIDAAAARLIAEHPDLNVLINNAGIMPFDDAAAAIDDEQAQAIISTNLLGPIRLTSGLVEHLKAQPSATIIHNSSVVAYTPIAQTAVYSASKAGLHSYSLSQRFMLRDTSVRVQEIVPPWVNTDLVKKTDDPRAMPLDEFIAQLMAQISTDEPELVVEASRQMRDNPGPNEHALVQQLNEFLVANPIPV